MSFEPFLMERWQSTWEHLVDVNLSESGVEPMTVRQLLDDDAEALARALDQHLIYVQTNGSTALRERLASHYEGATVEHVEVTTGGAEANQITTWTLLEPGDDVVVMTPNYMQVWGLAKAYGAAPKAWPLVPDPDNGRWRPDLEALEGLMTAGTRLIAICNPNNPTGSCLNSDELDAIGRIADAHGAWVLSDEIYLGAEIDTDVETPSMWGRAERVVISSGLSKAYGLPGLRIGWIVGPEPFVADCWARHDYTTIAPSAVSDHLATQAFDPTRRSRILDRTRNIIRANYPVISEWLDGHADQFTYIAPSAGAMLWLRYASTENSSALCERLRADHGVLVVPGDHYGMDHHLRIGFGGDMDHLRRGLERVAAAMV